MIAKLASKNIRKCIKDYSIYFFTLVLTVAIFYVFNALEAQSVMSSFSAAKSGILHQIAKILANLSVFISCVLGFLIVYANNFLVKRRKKEIGLYLLLGMSKRKVSTILTLETLIVGCFSLVIGIVLGIGLSQLLSFFIIQLFNADVSKFSFIFSSAAVFKTLLYFGIIFLLVMVFTVIMLSKYKLIDLLTAHKKNETIPIRNKKLTFFLFLLSLGLLAVAYILLFSGNILDTLIGITLFPIVGCGILGTYLFFFSLADFSLWIIQKCKTFYLQGLRMFILRQLSNNINTNVASITVISILLLITINILSSVISVANVYNSNLKNNNLSDFTINGTFYALGEPHIFAVESLVHEERFQKYVKEFALYDLYQSDELTLETLLTPAVKERIHKEEPAALFKRNISLMKESDFHRLMEVMHQPDLIFDITPEQYLLAANLQQMVTYYQPTLQDHHLLSFQGHSLAPATTTVLVTSLNNSSNANNQGVLIVDDSLLFPLEKNETKLVGNYNTFDTPEHIETAFTAFIAEKLKNKRTTEFLLTRQTMEIAGIGLGVIVSFVGLYVGIIFAICCVTILAVKQLSETSDTKERYQLLRKLGTDERDIKRSLFVQIGIYFLLPLVVAIVHSMLTLPELNHMLQKVGNLDVPKNIFWIICFIVLVYGGYFLATYGCSVSIIQEKKSEGIKS